MVNRKKGDNIINDSKSLVEAVNAAIDESGYKKSWIADQMGITRQAFSNILGKRNFTIDDANKILNVIGYSATVHVSKND